MLVLGYDDIHSLRSTHFSTEKSTPQYIVQILNNRTKPIFVCFNGLYVYQNNKFRSYLVDGIWEKKFKHITINDKDQLILAAESEMYSLSRILVL
jgi:regulator of extracellular matrix RemA (YlzA/DUF370 family)